MTLLVDRVVKSQEKIKREKTEVVSSPPTSSPVPNRFLGRLESNVLGEDFDDYIAQVKKFYEMNNFEDDKLKVRMFNAMGTAASSRLIKTLKPKQPTDLKFKEIVKEGQKLFVGSRNSIVEHFKFNVRDQKEGETLSDFAIELHVPCGPL